MRVSVALCVITTAWAQTVPVTLQSVTFNYVSLRAAACSYAHTAAVISQFYHTQAFMVGYTHGNQTVSCPGFVCPCPGPAGSDDLLSPTTVLFAFTPFNQYPITEPVTLASIFQQGTGQVAVQTVSTQYWALSPQPLQYTDAWLSYLQPTAAANSSLSAGAIFGIVIAVLGFIAICVFVWWYINPDGCYLFFEWCYESIADAVEYVWSWTWDQIKICESDSQCCGQATSNAPAPPRPITANFMA